MCCDRSHLAKRAEEARLLREFRELHGRLPRHRAEFQPWCAERQTAGRWIIQDARDFRDDGRLQ
jgi:hypothetical protein